MGKVRTRVAVIGAGPCGLVSTKSLSEQGLDVTCFEMSSCVGGHWKLDNPNGRSAAYESLTTNTTKKMSRLSDYEMPADWPELPTHEHMYRWWCDYVEKFGFAECIQLSHLVQKIEPMANDTWCVHWIYEDCPQSASFDAVVLASGGYWSPNVPELPGIFSGDVIHARAYRSPSRPIETTGKRVLVIGSSNTGCELALEISKALADRVILSARSGNWILPKYIDTAEGRQLIASGVPLSHPCDEVPVLLRKLPASWRERLFGTIGKFAMRNQFGEHAKRLTQAGLPPPPKNPFAKRPAIADGLSEALEQGSISAQGAIVSVDNQQVTFASGATETIDVIIYATGYRLSYPYLDQSVLNTNDDDMVLYRGLMHPQHHSLFVAGVSRPSGGFWPIAEVQAQFIAKLLSGQYELPSQSVIDKTSMSVLKRDSFNPALYGLSLREELARGAQRI